MKKGVKFSESCAKKIRGALHLCFFGLMRSLFFDSVKLCEIDTQT